MVGRPVVVRRNAGLAALVGCSASAVAIAYLWRVTASGSALDWTVGLLMAGIAAVHLAQLVDARTPLLVADDLGMRIRLGSQWRVLPWDSVATIVVRARRGLLREGRLVLDPQDLAASVDGLDARGRRAVALNRRLYGAPLAVPLSLSTRVSARGQRLVGELGALAGHRAEVLSGPTARAAAPAPAQPAEQPRRSILGGLGTVVSRAAKRRRHRPSTGLALAPQTGHEDPDARVEDDDAGLPALPTVRSAVQLRAARRGLRAQVTRDTPGRAPQSAEPGAAATDIDPQLGNVRPIAPLGDAVQAPVIDDFAVQPASDPVIGPELAAARARVGLSVDELAERTFIRPHVIESIEVDDFAPCGGDFYARGHLRTLARVLGRDAGPMLEHFDRRYATAPVDARQVFEAELATGLTAGARRTAGGPNWALLVGVVLVLAMTWGVMRLFASEPPERLQPPVNSLSGSAAAESDRADGDRAAGTTPVRLALVGLRDGSPVLVRESTGRVVWAGDLAPGERRTLEATPPVRVRAENAGAVQASVDGRDLGPVGRLGEPGRRVYGAVVDRPVLR